MSLLCRVWLALLETLVPTVLPARKWVTNELFEFPPLLWKPSQKWCQAAVQSSGTTAHKPIPRDKWDLILQVFCVISVGNKASTLALIKLKHCRGQVCPITVMWWVSMRNVKVSATSNDFILFLTCKQAASFYECVLWIFFFNHILGGAWKIWSTWNSCE